MLVFACFQVYMYACICMYAQNKLHNYEILSESSAHLRTLIKVFTVCIRYTDHFLIWAVSHEKGTIAYMYYEGSEQSGLIMLWARFLAY